jgi:hypothetical protein
MKTILPYKDGVTAEFTGEPLELDLQGTHMIYVFSINVYDANDTLLFSAYNWSNTPKTLEGYL